MISIQKLFDDINKNELNLLRKYPGLNHKISMYYGYSKQGNFRLAIKSSIYPFATKSTKVINYSYVESKKDEFWSYFDLVEIEFIKIFYKFAESILEVINENKDESNTLLEIQNLFNMWKKMFEKKKSELSDERAQGLFGELATLIDAPRISINSITTEELVQGWGGGHNLTKDISYKETWFEIKTRKSNTDKIKITRIEQLESVVNGYLVVPTVEVMSAVYNVNPSSINDLVEIIISQIKSPYVKTKFLEELDLYGYDIFQEITSHKFSLLDISYFLVDDNFPRLKKEDIKKQEIIEVSYSLSLSSLERYKVHSWN